MSYNYKMKVIFVDNHLLAVEKPILVPTQGEQDSLHELAKKWVKKTYEKTGNVFLEPVHRLDKPVGGVVLFARTSKALSRLNEAMREKTYQKIYLARIAGRPAQDEGTLEHYLVHDDFYARIVSPENPEAKKAILTYEVLFTSDNISTVRIQLITGRYHQIRAQFSAIGHPIVGDAKYGSSLAPFAKGIDLHHTRFELNHPVTKQKLVLESRPPFVSPLTSFR